MTDYNELYPPTEDLPVPKGALCVWSSNDLCLACKRSIDQQKPGHLVVLDCKHAYHMRCVRSYLDKDGMECLKCFDESQKKTAKAMAFSEDPGKDEDSDEEPVRSEIEDYYRDLHGDKVLSVAQKMRLTGIRNPIKAAKIIVDLSYLIEKEKTLDDLHDAGLNLLDIYFGEIEANRWSDLQSLGLVHDHLFLDQGRDSFLPLNQLIDLYEISYDNLLDIGFNMNRAVKYGFHASELKALGVTFESLTESYGMRRAHMFQFENISFQGWRGLGFTKEHLIEYRFTYPDLRKLRWDYRVVSNKFKLNEVEKMVLLQGAKLPKPNRSKRPHSRKQSSR